MSSSHSHTETHEATETPGGLNSGLILVVAIVSCLIVFVLVTAADAWYRNMAHSRDANFTWKQQDANLKAYLDEQYQRLGTLHYTTDDRKTVALPIEQGLDAYLQSQQGVR